MKSFVVIGLGLFGSSAARQLCALGAEVLAIDTNPDLVQQVSTDVTSAVVADARDAEVLRALGAQAGHLVYYLQEESPSLERLAHWLLEIRRMMDEAGVPFVDIDLSLRYLRDENDRRPHSDLYVLHFPYEEIYEEGLLERVKAANADAIAYYAELDKLK